MTPNLHDKIESGNSDSKPISGQSGREANDPHDGQVNTPMRPDPDPIAELATIDDSGAGGAADRPHLALQPGPKPGFGPDELSMPEIEGNPDLGIDPRDVAGRGQRPSQDT